ncbi:NHLP leader peptide family RiPP precursor [Paenibacillus sinopodophylli]|uniref:NHLP leader peptide family RiPP precursor n=1 Tax=Paenibacillus sinopodophylli TaxID=1837342 RepID=UPI001FE2A367|nr:NHLP leader peptide family RiPP precursor [Paenibacillus sinopodophylli]
MTVKQTLQEQIVQKAWEDAEFKKQLIADPKTAVKEAFGVDVPDSIEVEVVEETASKYYLVLPQNPSDIRSEDDSQLSAWQ